MLLISQSQSYAGWVLGFGVLVGAGIGFGYSSATPAALKWFPPARTGLVAGVVVAGFGLAPVYISPLSQYLLTTHGLRGTTFFYAFAFGLAVCGLAQLLANPPAGYVAVSPTGQAPGKTGKATVDSTAPGLILRLPAFYRLWSIYFIGAGAGLMVISSISGMARKSMGNAAFVAVAVMALGNAAGRVAAGFLSDKIGRRQTLLLVLLFQAALMFAAIPVAASKGLAAAPVLNTGLPVIEISHDTRLHIWAVAGFFILFILFKSPYVSLIAFAVAFVFANVVRRFCEIKLNGVTIDIISLSGYLFELFALLLGVLFLSRT